MGDGTGILVRPFGGEERQFLLGIDGVRALQTKTDCGPVELIRRYATGSWRIDDVREALFQGLVGGGSTQLQATVLIRDNFDNQRKGYAQFVPLAHDIVAATTFGPQDEEVDAGEPKAGA